MTPSFIMNSSPSVFEPNEDHDHHNQFFASSSSYSYQFYFNSTQDQTGGYPSEVYNSQQHLEGGGSYEVIENKVDNNGLKLSLGNKESVENGDQEAQKNPMKWMSSKMRLKIEDHHHQKHSSSSNLEADNYSSNSSSNNSNTPIRVCSDCNTTKTPLWRSGPKGPKSLCNACGIRQRKARRAMAAAAAAAAANGTPFSTETTPTVKLKMHHNKEKTKNNNPQTVPIKKRCKLAIDNNNAATTTSSSKSQAQEPKKLGGGGFEDFLINLSNKLAFHHVFPQDEKEAAILLMAISSGLVHG